MKFIYLFIFVLISLTASCQNNKKPNIILILADDAGIGDYEPYNTMFNIDDDIKLQTPNIKKLSEEGMLFTNAYSTGAVCQPSRFSIITGEFPIRKNITGTTTSIKNRIISEDVKTIGAMFQQNGYQTAAFGKWHLDYLYTANNDKPTTSPSKAALDKPLILGVNDYGFDYSFWLPKGVSGAEFFIENNTIVRLEKESLDKGVKPWVGHRRWETNTYKKGETLKELNKHILGDAIVDKALDYMEEAVKSDKPFFMYVPLVAPHAPHLPNRDVNGIPLDKGALNFKENHIEGARQKMVYENDIIVGQIIEQLKRLDITNNTIVIFTSDNGPGKPGAINDGASGIYKGYKGTAWEGGTKAPLIIKWPNKIKKGTVTNALVSQVDFYNTFKDLIGAFHADLNKDSKSFLPVLLNEKTESRGFNIATKHKVDGYANFNEGLRNIGIKTKEGYKLILYYNETTKTYHPIEFYNLNTDVSEINNQVKAKEYQNIIKQMLTKLEKGLTFKEPLH